MYNSATLGDRGNLLNVDSVPNGNKGSKLESI